ncbi:phage morphogenesis protein [Clostridium beijerinckii]|uniref:phage morphogenesis protein n=1 Tax=Clostridium beijerinckii TaxID=1520 RepID=UPI00156ED883|nr:phage morphogenesis protein [Clostridium beijerinckii]NRU52558.1 hypothetical protein [Clostridium beijerinckii]NYC69265.1 hypothetical protein [Clostridium beijerinckii]NYC91759.1 hypothetical protein [Clostridium beijerinckii]
MEITLKPEAIQLGKRVYNSKDINSESKDGQAITELAHKAINANGTINNLQAFRDLNQLIVTTAEQLQQPNRQQYIDLVSDYKKVGVNDIMQYNVEDKITKVTTALTATGTGVNFTKVPSFTSRVYATPYKHQFGIKYSISEMYSDPINQFKNAVDLVNEEKVRYILSQIFAVVREASANSKIPAKQKSTVANITFQGFKAIETALLRYSKNVKPVMIADTALIGSLADKQASVMVTGSTTVPMYLTDDMRKSLLTDTTIEQISKTVAISIDNPYIDNMNSKVELPVDEAILIAGGSASPIKVTEFGDMALLSDIIQQHIESEEAFLKIAYKVDVTLLLNRAIGYIKDTSVVL